MAYRPPFIDERAITIEGRHPSTLEEPDFLSQCEIETGRVSGPGGQHRNRVDTAVWIKHVPTAVEAPPLGGVSL
ncbi:MAG: peptide chain release factor family protein, partial [bacterium]